MELTNTEFRPYSKNDWENKITQSLKSIHLSDIRWEVFPGLEGLPFAGKEDLVSPPMADINFGKNDWNIGVMISDPGMMSLLGEEGIEAIFIHLKEENWQNLAFAQFNMQMNWHLPVEIVLNLSGQNDFGNEFSEFIQNAHGSLMIESLKNHSFAELQRLFSQRAKGFDMVFHLESQKTSKQKLDSYIGFIRELTEWIENENLNEEDVAWLFDHLGVMLSVSHQFLFEIAFLRSMQIVWQNVQKLYHISSGKLKLSVLIDNDFSVNSSNDHLIMNTVSVTAAMLSGAGTIFVKSESMQGNMIENQILAKNLQLICRHEVRLDMVGDALAGSYALEDLTAKLANYIWSGLKQI